MTTEEAARKLLAMYEPGIKEEVVSVWRGMERGHPVKVKGERGSFTFRSATMRNDECVSVCVVGGSANHSLMRHFTPDRIIKKRVSVGVR
jgi:hypothetical protein